MLIFLLPVNSLFCLTLPNKKRIPHKKIVVESTQNETHEPVWTGSHQKRGTGQNYLILFTKKTEEFLNKILWTSLRTYLLALRSIIIIEAPQPDNTQKITKIGSGRSQ